MIPGQAAAPAPSTGAMMIILGYRRLRKNPAFKATTRDEVTIVDYGVIPPFLSSGLCGLVEKQGFDWVELGSNCRHQPTVFY
jgi:hypothetical protein